MGEAGPYPLPQIGTDPEKGDEEAVLLGPDGTPVNTMTTQDRRSLCISIFTLILSIPALIGA